MVINQEEGLSFLVGPGRKILKQEPNQLPGSDKILLPGTGTETLFLVGYWFLAGSFGFGHSLELVLERIGPGICNEHC